MAYSSWTRCEFLHCEGQVGKVMTMMNLDNATSSKPGYGSLLLQALVPMAVGAFFLYRHRPVAAVILFGIGALLLVSGLFIPVLFFRIERIGQAVGRVVGLVLTWIILLPMFYLVFVPGRLILMIRGIDPMCRKFPTDAPTYWVPRKPVGSVEEYKRQF